MAAENNSKIKSDGAPDDREPKAVSSKGSLHPDIPRKFGDAAEYWVRYGELADAQDKELIHSLRDNLDVLPTFVSGLAC